MPELHVHKLWGAELMLHVHRPKEGASTQPDPVTVPDPRAASNVTTEHAELVLAGKRESHTTKPATVNLYDTTQTCWTLGRGKDTDLCSKVPGRESMVSRKHASIFDQHGDWQLQDTKA